MLFDTLPMIRGGFGTGWNSNGIPNETNHGLTETIVELE